MKAGSSTFSAPRAHRYAAAVTGIRTHDLELHKPTPIRYATTTSGHGHVLGNRRILVIKLAVNKKKHIAHFAEAFQQGPSARYADKNTNANVTLITVILFKTTVKRYLSYYDDRMKTA